MIANLPEIIALIESGWRNARVLVVGDVMFDKYIWGEVERISPEAPVPIVRATWQNERPGGAANVAMNLAGLGACVTVAGFGGGDDEQGRVESMLAEAGIEPALTEVAAIPTTTKLRIFSGNQQMMRLDTEAVPPPSSAAYTELLKSVSSALPNADVVVLSDYAKGVLTETVCRSIIAEAGNLGVPVLVDPKQRDFSRYRGATTICPNLKELSAASGEPVGDVDRVLAAGQAQLASAGYGVHGGDHGRQRHCGLAQGLAPARSRGRSARFTTFPGQATRSSQFWRWAWRVDVEIETAVQLANLAAGIVVNKLGHGSHSAGRIAGRPVAGNRSAHGRENPAPGATTGPRRDVALCRRARGVHATGASTFCTSGTLLCWSRLAARAIA